MDREEIIYFVVDTDKNKIVYITMIQEDATSAMNIYKQNTNHRYKIEKSCIFNIYYGITALQIMEGYGI